MSCIKAVIVAGGKGTRIHSLSGGLIPKALVPVAGESVVFRQLELLARYGVCDVTVLAGYLGELLKEKMVPKAAALGMHLEFFMEDEALGTAGCLREAHDLLSRDEFFVLYGDVAIEMDIMRLLAFHREKKGVATVVAHPNDHPHESDLLRIDKNGRILEILSRKKRAPGFYRNCVPAAVYCLSGEILKYIEPSTKQDFIADVFPKVINGGCSVYAYITSEYLRDMGTVTRHMMVEKDIRSGLFKRMNFCVKRPAIFFDRDGVLNHELGGRGLIHHKELELIPNAAEAIRLVNDAGWLAVVTTNQPALAKGFTTFDEMELIHAKLESLLGYEHAKLDSIYFCSHHPESGFEGEVAELKIECDCRKPKVGMLLQAVRELPILLDESCLIGDSWRDMGAARAAGIRAYGVRTGCGCRDCKENYKPDMIFSDVLEAVKFVLSDASQNVGLPKPCPVSGKRARYTQKEV